MTLNWKIATFILSFTIAIKVNSQSLQLGDGTLINTPYHFSVTIPKNWKLLSNQEIEEEKKSSNNQLLIMPALAYLGDKKHFDTLPHIYVIFYSQPKIGELGFNASSKIILSNYVQNYIETKMEKIFPEWQFSTDKDYYYTDSVKRMVTFSSSSKYSEGYTTKIVSCFFLMETGAAEINFSFNSSLINEYDTLMKKIWATVKIDPKYTLLKD